MPCSRAPARSGSEGRPTMNSPTAPLAPRCGASGRLRGEGPIEEPEGLPDRDPARALHGRGRHPTMAVDRTAPVPEVRPTMLPTLTLALAALAAAAPEGGPIRLHPENPRYFL